MGNRKIGAEQVLFRFPISDSRFPGFEVLNRLLAAGNNNGAPHHERV